MPEYDSTWFDKSLLDFHWCSFDSPDVFLISFNFSRRFSISKSIEINKNQQQFSKPQLFWKSRNIRNSRRLCVVLRTCILDDELTKCEYNFMGEKTSALIPLRAWIYWKFGKLIFAPAGGLCTACRNQPTTSKSVILWGFFQDFLRSRGWGWDCEVFFRDFRGSRDGAHFVRFFPGFP